MHTVFHYFFLVSIKLYVRWLSNLDVIRVPLTTKKMIFTEWKKNLPKNAKVLGGGMSHSLNAPVNLLITEIKSKIALKHCQQLFLGYNIMFDYQII